MKLSRNSLYIIYLFCLALLFIVPNALAQSGDLEFGDILDALGPRDGDELLWDILLYLIFFTSIVTMFLVPDKQLSASLLNFTVIFLAVISKLLVSTAPDAAISPCDLPVLGINAGMFALPLIMAGMVRNANSKKVGSPAAMMTGIATGFMGGAYFFLFWAMAQQDCAATPI